jgi:hypothetical protein
MGIPRAINREIARAMLNGAAELIEDLRNPEGAARQPLLAQIGEAADELTESPEQALTLGRRWLGRVKAVENPLCLPAQLDSRKNALCRLFNSLAACPSYRISRLSRKSPQNRYMGAIRFDRKTPPLQRLRRILEARFDGLFAVGDDGFSPHWITPGREVLDHLAAGRGPSAALTAARSML